MPVATFTTIWEFQVKPEARSQFESIYGPNGDWAQLFRRSPEYRETTLLQDPNRPGRYFTLDQWTSREALHQFKREHMADYAALDKKCEGLTDNELHVGDFEPVADMKSES